MHTPTCRHTHTRKHFQVIVLEFMGHIIYRHALYVWIQDVLIQKETDCVQLLDGIRANVRRKPPRGIYLPRKTSSASRQLLYTRSDLPSEGDWTGEGRGRGKTAIFLLFPTQSPLLLPGVAPLSPQNPGGNERPRGRDDLREILISSFNTMIVLTIFKL